MSEDTNGLGQTSGQDSKEAGDGGRNEQRLLLNSQYIKDLSFENPNAPLIYAELGPDSNIDVSIDLDLSHLQDRLYETVLSLHVKASVKDKVAFLVELEFAALATVGTSVPEAERERLLLTEVPRHLFPFARAIIGDVSRDGGFPPLLINPINFEDLYEHRRKSDEKLMAGAET